MKNTQFQLLCLLSNQSYQAHNNLMYQCLDTNYDQPANRLMQAQHNKKSVVNTVRRNTKVKKKLQSAFKSEQQLVYKGGNIQIK